MNLADFAAELRLPFERQRAAFAAQPYPDWVTRRDRLQRLQQLLLDNEAVLIAAIDSDFGGRPAAETQIAEIFPSLQEIKHALAHGERWMKVREVGVSKWFLPARAQVLPQPLGVVGVLAPWNYPLYLSIAPMVAAVAAGNRVLLKPSEFTPAFGELLARLLAERFAPEEVTAVLGGAEVAASFSALPFDHLFFTGSTAVGRKVMAAAAANLTPVTLELGGKSPTVITPGYPLAHAVQRILAGKLLNAGQTCIAPDYVLLPRDSVEAFVIEARRQAQHMVPQGLASAAYCSVVNARQYDRLQRNLGQARVAGARVEPLFDGTQQDDAGHRLAPQLVIDPPVTLELMQDEIFGPLLPLLPYDRLDEALQFIRARPRPLALYWFDHDTARTEQMLRATHAGGVSVNETILHVAQDTLPFGGIGPSGMGHYHGRWGFETFSKLKPVFRQARFNGVGLFTPPYRPLTFKLLQLMKRW
jgi:coniferyl-aldehyde dehydrogenase